METLTPKERELLTKIQTLTKQKLELHDGYTRTLFLTADEYERKAVEIQAELDAAKHEFNLHMLKQNSGVAEEAI